jgi:hypothetical protein
VARAYHDKVLLWCSHIGFQLLCHTDISFHCCPVNTRIDSIG